MPPLVRVVFFAAGILFIAAAIKDDPKDAQIGKEITKFL